MPKLPQLSQGGSYSTSTDVFYGLDRRLKAQDGTFSAMSNLSGEEYPVLSTRKYRGNFAHLNVPQGIIAKDALAWVDGGKLYYNGLEVEGVNLSANGEKQLVSMGAYLVIFPDKYYINTQNLIEDHGYMEQHNAPSGSVAYAMCDENGKLIENVTVSSEPPETTVNGSYWIDTNGSTHILLVYSESSKTWENVPTVYVRIYSSGIGIGLKDGDGVSIEGAQAEIGEDDDASAPFVAQVAALNGKVIAHRVNEDYIVVTGILDKTTYQADGVQLTVSRTVPDMDFVTEAGNRLWGCKYGLVNGEPINEIYCCSLGDFKNWNKFQGLSTDSWVASQGSDGVFTGAITHMGYPLFFKENCLHKVYPSSTGAHQVQTTICRGVQDGSHKSLVVVDEYLYYKSRTDVCVYDGSLPVSVSEALGNEKYYDAVAGAFAGRYHISMRDSDGYWHMMVYDTATRLWHEEDDFHALQFAQMDDDLYAIHADTGVIWALYGSVGTPEHELPWMAETSIIGFEYPEQFRLSRWNLRADVPEGSVMDVYVQYNSDGRWIHVHHVEGDGHGSILIPVIARRCDHLQVKMEGTGEVKLYSFAKKLVFSGERWHR